MDAHSAASDDGSGMSVDDRMDDVSGSHSDCHGHATSAYHASRVTTASVIPDSSNTSSDEGSASRERGGESSESQRSAALIPVHQLLKGAVPHNAPAGSLFTPMFNLNLHYMFIAARSSVAELLDAGIHIDERSLFLTMDVPLREFVLKHPHLRAQDVRKMAAAHNVTLSSSLPKFNMISACFQHRCVGSCKKLVYLFQSLKRSRDGRTSSQPYTEQFVRDRLVNMREKRRVGAQDRRHLVKGLSSRTRDNVRQATVVEPVAEPESTESTTGTDSFPHFASDSQKKTTAEEWEEAMSPENWSPIPCAVCRQGAPKRDMLRVDAGSIDLTLLRNEDVPEAALPMQYDINAYDGAILHYESLECLTAPGMMSMCKECHSYVVGKGQTPPASMANHLFYGWENLPPDVAKAYSEATLADLMMVARCRMSNITHYYVWERNSPAYGRDPTTSHTFSRGNVAVLPQNTLNFRDVLPPNAEEVEHSICAMFVGGEMKLTKESIKKIGAVPINKRRVQIILDFLLKHNMPYKRSGVVFSKRNLDALYDNEGDPDADGTPSAMKWAHLEREGNNPSEVTAGYDDRDQLANATSGDEDVLMEPVGYADINRDPIAWRGGKTAALAWALSGKNFLEVRSGSELMKDYDPDFLTFAFPHLDPWGIGAFYEPRRKESLRISFAAQVKYMMRQYKSPFAKDPNFAFVCFNILQKNIVRQNSMFKVSKKLQQEIVDALALLAPVLEGLSAKWEKDPNAPATTDDERSAMGLLNKLNVVSADLKGSNGYKVCRRNEARALIKKFSTPALFITLNPSDLTHPLLGVVAGLDPSEWRSMTPRQRATFVARNPDAAAKFFDGMVHAFIDIILRYGRSGPGLFGECEAYYGMVEAQGKGTLHCHMLIWLKGNPSPQELRDRMAADGNFSDAMVKWLESIISCQLPSNKEVVVETEGVKLKPPPMSEETDPRLREDVPVKDMTEEEFQAEFRRTVEDLASKCNWHQHSHTCWKYLKPGEPRDDDHCRMRIDGHTRPLTVFDPETQSILLKRLHPRINNFNDLVIFLMKCNMDIKYIGSGEAAKALVYYVTDYITKRNLQTHVGFNALKYAVKQQGIKYANVEDADKASMDRSLLTKSINALASRQELSHQQVMSYLVGGGDYYSSHLFRNLRWMDFQRYVRNMEDSLTGDETAQSGGDMQDVRDDTHMQAVGDGEVAHDSSVDPVQNEERDEDEEDEVVLCIQEGKIEVTDHVQDYCRRSKDAPFDGLCVWDHTAWVATEKTTRHDLKAQERRNKEQDGKKIRGPKPLPRGSLAGTGHRMEHTHVQRMRKEPFVPLLIGRSLPRSDRTVEEREQWSRVMLILFKPWRTLMDLKGGKSTWIEAFESTEFSDEHKQYMKNFGVEHECKDARTRYDELRRSGKIKSNMLDGVELGPVVGEQDDYELYDRMFGDTPDDRIDLDVEDTVEPDLLVSTNRNMTTLDVGALRRTGIFDVRASAAEYAGEAEPVRDIDKNAIREQNVMMNALSKRKRPAREETDPEKRRKLNGTRVEPKLAVAALSDKVATSSRARTEVEDVELVGTPEYEMDRIVVDPDFRLRDNPEQERAFRIVGDHFASDDPRQLFIYVSGVGGTGKSHVVNAITELFARCDASNQLIRSAPTGCAAVVIDGYTIHALTIMSEMKKEKKNGTQPSNKTIKDLETLWRGIRYLVLDEVSMVSANLMLAIHMRLVSAFGGDPMQNAKPFGGINVIFTGDMGQLKPIGGNSLFKDEYVSLMPNDIRERPSGQDAVFGAWLWRQTNNVVELKRNMRSLGDPKYTAMIARIRAGQVRSIRHVENALKAGEDCYDKADYDVLLTRLLSTLKVTDHAEFDRFRDAPVIVIHKEIRDFINRKRIDRYAAETSQEVHMYHARDKIASRYVPDDVQRRLWRCNSTKTENSMSLLPVVPGMKVMFTSNLAVQKKIANGTEGILRSLKYRTDGEGRRFAVVAYVQVEGCDMERDDIPSGLVPVFPMPTPWKYTNPEGSTISVSREQLPLVPAYAYTDYKSQGRTLPCAVVDLIDCSSIQSIYVMLSRVKSLRDVAVLRWFRPNKMLNRLDHDLREELDRISRADELTTYRYERGVAMSLDTELGPRSTRRPARDRERPSR